MQGLSVTPSAVQSLRSLALFSPYQKSAQPVANLRSPFLTGGGRLSSRSSTFRHPFALSADRSNGIFKRDYGDRPVTAVMEKLGRTVQRLFKNSNGAMATVASVATPPSQTDFVDTAPSLESLTEMISASGYGADQFRLAHAKERLFGTDGEPRLILFRDNSSWCPYCQRVWLQLEEKQIPYRVEKINMRCYGPKPAWYTKMVPSGLLPAVQIDGQLITESLDIMLAIETTFTDHKPLLPAVGSPDRRAVEGLLRLERQFMGAWLQWLTSPWGHRSAFEGSLDRVDAALKERGGPYFLGKEFSLVDAVFAPFLERAAASIPFWKGLVFRGTGRWPHLDRWFDAMDSRPIYMAMKSDDFTVTHCLEPQVGPCAPIPEGAAYRDLVEGRGGSWDLPLKPETTAWGYDDGSGREGAREEAAKSLVQNHDAIVGFALRGVRDGEVYRDAVSAGFRVVAHALLRGVEAGSPVPEGLPKQVAVAAAYLRDRIGVPRDLTYPAARQLRAHLNWLVRELGSEL